MPAAPYSARVLGACVSVTTFRRLTARGALRLQTSRSFKWHWYADDAQYTHGFEMDVAQRQPGSGLTRVAHRVGQQWVSCCRPGANCRRQSL